MNILVLTSAITDSHFSVYQNTASIKPNPSNQIFYSKLIKALSINNTVAVVSLRPFSKGMFKENSLQSEHVLNGNINYFYSRVSSNKFYKTFGEFHDVLKTAKEAIDSFKSNDFIVVTDTLRFNLLKTALKLKKLYGCKIIGMLTDNPFNLTGFKKSYAAMLLTKVSQLDGYLSLTNKLVDIVKPGAPSYVFEGLVDDVSVAPFNRFNNYFFFAGSLYERYGVKKLVDAFRLSECKSKLLIAGSGSLSKYIDRIAYEDDRILFLSQLSKEKVSSYELGSLANINPRPLDDKLDKESVPSKLLEYLSKGVPVISTKFPKLYNIFKDNVTWIEDCTVAEIKNVLESFEKCDISVQKKNASIAKSKAFEFYGLDVQGESITHFLLSFK